MLKSIGFNQVCPNMCSITERYCHGPHCYWAACQHPCCWEAERRLAKGILPQEVKLPSRECATVNGNIAFSVKYREVICMTTDHLIIFD